MMEGTANSLLQALCVLLVWLHVHLTMCIEISVHFPIIHQVSDSDLHQPPEFFFLAERSSQNGNVNTDLSLLKDIFIVHELNNETGK